MAVFRDGVKIGKFDVRTGLSKKRVQDLAKKVGLIEGYDDAAKIAPYGCDKGSNFKARRFHEA